MRDGTGILFTRLSPAAPDLGVALWPVPSRRARRARSPSRSSAGSPRARSTLPSAQVDHHRRRHALPTATRPRPLRLGEVLLALVECRLRRSPSSWRVDWPASGRVTTRPDTRADA